MTARDHYRNTCVQILGSNLTKGGVANARQNNFDTCWEQVLGGVGIEQAT